MPYRPHLVSSTTRPVVRPLVQKVFGDFDPLRLDPYLFFDAATSMVGTLENPTLDLDPATPSTLDVITATRAGIATYTDPDGNIATASADTVRVDYTQGAELTPTKFQNIGYTDFSSGWGTYLGTATLGDGYDSQASLVCSFTGTGQSYQEFQSVDGMTYTGSVWARAVSASGPYRLFHGNSASGLSTYINLTSEWQFFSVQFLGRSGGGTMYFGIGARNGDSVEIAMPQVEEGTTASSFVANTTGSPKFIASATFGPRVPMILVEPSSENLFTHSEGINNFSTLSRTNCTYSLDSNPFGGFNSSCKITSNTFTNGAIKAVLIFNSVSGESNYFTLRVKKKNGWFLKVVAGNGTSSSNVDVGLSGEGFISAGGTTANSYTVEEFNDYYLIGIETLQNATTIAGLISLIFYPDNSFSSYDLNTVEDFFVTGIQFENNATVPTSYIPTSGSTVTRAKDDLEILGSAFSNFFNSGGDGTFFLTAVVHNPEARYSILRGGSNVQLYLYTNAGSGEHFNHDGGSMTYGTVVKNQLTNFAVSYNSSTHNVSRNGSSSSPASASGNFRNATKLEIGKGYDAAGNFNGHIKRLIYWPYHSDSL